MSHKINQDIPKHIVALLCLLLTLYLSYLIGHNWLVKNCTIIDKKWRVIRSWIKFHGRPQYLYMLRSSIFFWCFILFHDFFSAFHYHFLLFLFFFLLFPFFGEASCRFRSASVALPSSPRGGLTQLGHVPMMPRRRATLCEGAPPST